MDLETSDDSDGGEFYDCVEDVSKIPSDPAALLVSDEGPSAEKYPRIGGQASESVSGPSDFDFDAFMDEEGVEEQQQSRESDDDLKTVESQQVDDCEEIVKEDSGLAPESAEPTRSRREIEDELSDTEKEERHSRGLALKAEGNDHFGRAEFEEAILKYTDALDLCPLCYETDRAVWFSNRAACHMKLDQLDDAIEDCTSALELEDTSVKALYRRAWCLERKGDDGLDRALDDYKQLLTLQPNNAHAKHALMTLPAKIAERNERMKNEMIEKLKDLGNMVLRPFGLSTNNFQLKEQPSGGYSIQMTNNE